MAVLFCGVRIFWVAVLGRGEDIWVAVLGRGDDIWVAVYGGVGIFGWQF